MAQPSDSALPNLAAPALTLEEAWACRRSDPQRTVALARAARQRSQQPHELAQAALCVGYGLTRLGEFSSAEAEIQQALKLYQILGDEEGRRKSLNVLGILQCEIGDLIASLKTFIEVRQLSAALSNVQGEIEAINNLGNVYGAMGDHANTLDYQLTALRLSQQHGIRTTEVQALVNLSAAYYDLSRYHEALSAAQRCLEIEHASEPALHALALHNAGRAHFGLGDYSLAQSCHKDALALFTRIGDQAACAEVYLELGRVAQQQLDLTGAQSLYERSLALRQQVGDLRGQAESWLRLGELLGRLRQTGAALDALHEARSLAEQSNARTELSAADLALCQTYRQAGQHREALHHLEQHLQVKEALFNDASDQRLQRLKVQFDVEQAERERDLAHSLSDDLKTLNLQLERTNRELEDAHHQSALLLAQVERQANEDALTGLANRRAFDAAAQRLQSGVLLSVVLCDIDLFKRVNDQFSHLVGDEVLRQVARLLKRQLRQGDLLARYGGEEFVILMQGADAVTTGAICERLRRSVEAHAWAAIRPGLQITISLGAAVAQLDGPVEALTQVADDALYEAKHAGRNLMRLRSAAGV